MPTLDPPLSAGDPPAGPGAVDPPTQRFAAAATTAVLAPAPLSSGRNHHQQGAI
ncbi:MAG: hypothetical protein ACRDRK_21610 [Pseudonocardia sp.]